MTVPPAAVAANRSLLLALIATNFFGQNGPAIATTEAAYDAMWAQDTTVMNCDAASAAAASNLPPVSGPPAVAVATRTSAAGHPAQPVSLAGPFTAVDAFNDTVSSLSGAASVSSSSFGGASIGMTNHAITINAERDAHQGLGPFLGIGPEPSAAPRAVSRPAVSALLRRASIAGALSVPQNWAATVTPPATALTAPAAFAPGVFGEALLGTLAGRGVNITAAKLRRRSVVPHSPAAG